MTFQPFKFAWLSGPRIRRLLANRLLVTTAVVLAIVGVLLWRGLRAPSVGDPPARLSAAPSEGLNEAVSGHRLPFAASVVQSIRRNGWATVTVHAALDDRRTDGKPTKSGDGDNPTHNLYWGARHGIETHLTKIAGWRRVYVDQGDGKRIVRRVVLQQRVKPTDAWRARGINEPFDLYVLANAWVSGEIVAAMEQPLRDAFANQPLELVVEGRKLRFGADSTMVGYVGQNRMLDQYWDPFAGLDTTAATRQMGVFYICPRSAVVLYSPVVSHGLYPVLFARESIVPEAYLLDGLLSAFAEGDLDKGFLTSAAAEYARFQKDVSPQRAGEMLYR
ncbi:MAG TPA: hypothetical protein VMV94_10010 [Phycisphaerae bacterium]|nr:hypothetical protein [Phycisphaerae bacterium]